MSAFITGASPPRALIRQAAKQPLTAFSAATDPSGVKPTPDAFGRLARTGAPTVGFDKLALEAFAPTSPADVAGFSKIVPGPFGSTTFSEPKQMVNEWARLFGNMADGAAATTPGTAPPPGTSATGGGAPGQATGEFARLNQYDPYFQQAAAEFGVPVNALKAIAMIERGWEGTSPAGAVGIMQVMPEFWGNKGYDIYSTPGNIMAGALAYDSFYDQYAQEARARGMDPYVAAARAYLAGNPWSGQSDAYGTTTDIYGQRFTQYLNQLGGIGASTAAGLGVGASGQGIVSIATRYVGASYVWGSIPGKGEDPWQTGWDCSGMTYWLDQNYGSGQLPMGSHYQYDYAARTGQLFTNVNALQAGDLIFFDTGLRSGGGAELNNASHVGVYIGDGRMLHAANPSQGTIISDLNAYLNMYPYLGALRMPWSGVAAGTGATPGTLQGSIASQPSGLRIRDFLLGR